MSDDWKDDGPISLEEALRLLVEVHTRDDPNLGFKVMMGATPWGYQEKYYVEVWGVVRASLGMKTEKED